VFDIDAWQNYREAGYEMFERYCEKELGTPESKIQALMVVKDQCVPRPKKAGPAELVSWLHKAVEFITTTKLG
jgi:hypothetical protein